jgi:hypothetical protein
MGSIAAYRRLTGSLRLPATSSPGMSTWKLSNRKSTARSTTTAAASERRCVSPRRSMCSRPFLRVSLCLWQRSILSGEGGTACD